MRTLDEIRASISEKESEAKSIHDELQALNKTRRNLEEIEQEEFFRNPKPGDFWHDCFSPVLVVLEIAEGRVVIADRTLPVYEEADPAMILKSYETPDDPAVKAHFARPRKEIGYTFDLDRAKEIYRAEFDGMLKCYASMPDELTYRCVRGGRPSMELARLWSLRPKFDK